MIKKKIYCEARCLSEEEFDKIPMKELREMVGWIEYDDKHKTWDVTMADGGYFECKTQATAEIISSLEEIKAMMMKEKCKCTGKHGKS